MNKQTKQTKQPAPFHPTERKQDMTKIIPMIEPKPYWTEHYGILFESAFVYETNRSHSPTRLQVWDNTRRPNPDPGGPIQWGECGPLPTGGDGKWIDPNNRATDTERSYLIKTEATTIDAYGTGTGSVASGQVYSTDPRRICDGDRVLLRFADGAELDMIAVLPQHGNGYGYLRPTEPAE